MRYFQQGQYLLNKLNLIHDGGVINLKEAFVQIDIFESIWSPTMSGQVSILDSFNLPDILPLYGNERIEIEFTTAGNDWDVIYWNAVVYKLSEKHRVTEHNDGYTFQLISQEAINSQRMHTNRGYEDTISNICQKIHGLIKYEKGLEAIGTQALQKYCFGRVKPLEAIQLLTTEAVSAQKDHGYVYYEDNKQFNFKPLQYLYQRPPVKEFFNRQSGMYENVKQRAKETFDIMQNIEIMEENSFLDRVIDGQHGQRALRLDLYTKDWEEINYEKKKYYSPAKSLGRIPYKKETIKETPDDIGTIRYGHDRNTIFESIVRSRMAKAEINTFRAKISVFGDSYLRAGNVCYAHIPNWAKNADEYMNDVDGKFLMTDIHHMITNTKYFQVIMIQKEAYEDDFTRFLSPVLWNRGGYPGP